MALTRKFLSTLGIEDDKIDEIIAKHAETVNGLKDERDGYKEKANKLDDVTKELETLKKANKGDDVYKVKYEGIKEEFDTFKKDLAKKETTANKRKAYMQLLKDANISEKRHEAILKITELDNLELGEDGKFKNNDELKKEIETEWADFKVTEKKQGAKIETPPANNGAGSVTREDIRKIKDPVARQKAMMENPALFGLKGE